MIPRHNESVAYLVSDSVLACGYSPKTGTRIIPGPWRLEQAGERRRFGELHRYMPVLAVQQGWRVAEVPVNHRPRRYGRSRFGLERYTRGALDLLTVVFLGRYQYRPLHLFGGVGLVVTVIGIAISLYLTALKIAGAAIGQRPLLFLGILLIVVGVQLLTFGLLAQLIVVARQDREAPRLGAARMARSIGFDGDAAITDAAGGSERSTTGTIAPE